MPKGKQHKRKTDPRQDPFKKIAPQSIEGVEASDLPDHGRGSVETDYGKESARNLPQRTGGPIGGQTGMRANPDIVKSEARGGRKKN